ncbi:MAG: hypothetical protein COT88_02305 [Candidatus Colwellbacteria bacterium CG10_big_fil_rev_8_21_14_0_10_41_28]|uniref:Cell envelope-related transcriptional attenuator domain-containing protein n=1 Tax=Candidatus Colwellbacteria bacterium CG10_big_fil_rev_8_21_14_0_10_41_28 TaxID=1974539 RepID=A0A2H0VGX4_9BACT|nr:MAG: hypothetical protein COT88_02305 [Candidatus Colwellbacteria bacterium CG10_big_fil_rev_8_21_14_0_10_41_28]
MNKKGVFIIVALSAVLLGIVFITSSLGDKVAYFENREVVINDEGEINFLILGQVGVGQGGEWHQAPGLADTIIVANYKPEERVVNLISIPRDLYGDIGEYSNKANSVIVENKIEDFLSVASGISGLDVDNYIVVDLITVERIVDELGGITVTLEDRVTDPITGFSLPGGENALSGVDTVWLIRNRFAPDGDFFREHNQHSVIDAISKKFNSLSPAEKTAIAFKLLPELDRVSANFSFGSLVSQIRERDGVKFNSIVLDFSTGLLESSYIDSINGEMYILIPKEGVNNYEKIREYIKERLL